MVRDLTNRANKIARELKRWNSRYRYAGDRFPLPDPLSQPSDPSKAYRAFEQTVLLDWNAHNHSAADLSIGPVMQQYFSRRAPFDKEGTKEFPDAFALLALENWCIQKRERMYVVSRDKAIQRASEERDHFIAVDSLDHLLALVASAQDHDMAETVAAAFHGLALFTGLEDALKGSIDQVGGFYDGDREEGEVVAMEIDDLQDVEYVTILRVDKHQVACVVDVRLLVTAEILYTDRSGAMWDNEDKCYVGGTSVVTEIEDSVTAKAFVELERDGDDIALSSVWFLTQDLSISHYHDGLYD